MPSIENLFLDKLKKQKTKKNKKNKNKQTKQTNKKQNKTKQNKNKKKNKKESKMEEVDLRVFEEHPVCVVCLENPRNTRLPCGHETLCSSCALTIMQMKRRCPNCRKK